jgi:hypothetical protein
VILAVAATEAAVTVITPAEEPILPADVISDTQGAVQNSSFFIKPIL